MRHNIFVGCLSLAVVLVLSACGTGQGPEDPRQDTSAPTVPGVPTDGGEYNTTGSIDFSWSAAVDDESGVAAYELQVGTSIGGEDLFDINVGDVLSYTVHAAEGQTVYARVRAVNGENLYSEWSASSDGITVDSLAPSVPDVSAQAMTSDTTPTWSWSGGGGGIGSFRFKLNDSDLTVGASLTNDTEYTPVEPLSDGDHILYVQESDAAGNWSQSASMTVLVDTTAPAMMDMPQDGGDFSQTLSVLFSWPRASDAQSNIMGYNLQVGSSVGAADVFDGTVGDVLQFRVGADEGQTLYARIQAVNGAGMAGAWSGYSDGITVDTIAPGRPMVSASSPTSDQAPDWSWSGAGGGNGQFRYKLDDSDLSAGSILTSATSYTPTQSLSAGSHALYVQERDAAGNWSATATASVLIDITAPGMTTTPADGGLYSTSSEVQFSWQPAQDSESGVSAYRLQAGSSAGGNDLFDAVIGNILSYSVVGNDGQTVYARVQAINGAGSAGEWSASSDGITIDTTPPAAPIVSAQTPTGSSMPSWSWVSGGGGNGSYRLKIDDSDLSAGATLITSNNYSSPIALADGRHTLYLQERDEAGNWSVAALYVVLVDTLAPEVVAMNPGDGVSAVAADVSIDIVFSEAMQSQTVTANSIQVTLNGGGLVSGTLSLNDAGTIATFIPAGPLLEGSSYTVSVTGEALDLVNHPAVTYQGSFTTGIGVRAVKSWYSGALNWNDYRANDGADTYTASGVACSGKESGAYQACIHSGLLRAVSVPASTDCSNLSATDSLGVFDWQCIVTAGGSVNIVSAGFKPGKGLSDLIDVSIPAWRANAVQVLLSGVEQFATSATPWWSNQIVVANDGGELLVPGVVYLVNAQGQAEYQLLADSAALLISPSVELQGLATGGTSVVTAQGKFLWVEGAIIASGYSHGLALEQSVFSRLHRLQVSNADSGDIQRNILLSGASNNLLSGVSATAGQGHGIRLEAGSNLNTLRDIGVFANGVCGLYVTQSSGNRIDGVTASSNLCGVYFYDASGNYLKNVSASNNVVGVYYLNSDANFADGLAVSNNTYSGVQLDGASNNSLINITANNNGESGVFTGGVVVSGERAVANGNNFANITASNNDYTGVYLYISNGNTLSNVLMANNGSNNFGGLVLFYADNNTIQNVASYRGYTNIAFYLANDNHFTGHVKVGGDTLLGNCYIDTSTNPGLDSQCANNGTSDAVLETAIDLSAAFVGKLTADDGVNTTQLTNQDGSASFDNISDWNLFENSFRHWGMDGAAFPSTDQQGHCSSGGTCRVWDWSLADASTTVRDTLSAPLDGNMTLQHIWYSASPPTQQSDCDAAAPGSVFDTDHCLSTFLRNATEVSGDNIGNDNGLCESSEACLYTLNIGAYQGHSNTVSSGSFADGTLTGVSLVNHATNGYTVPSAAAGTVSPMSQTVAPIGAKGRITPVVAPKVLQVH